MKKWIRTIALTLAAALCMALSAAADGGQITPTFVYGNTVQTAGNVTEVSITAEEGLAGFVGCVMYKVDGVYKEWDAVADYLNSLSEGEIPLAGYSYPSGNYLSCGDSTNPIESSVKLIIKAVAAPAPSYTGASSYTVSFTPGESGTITSEKTSFSVSAGAFLLQTPAVSPSSGFVFAGWSLDGLEICDPLAEPVRENLEYVALYEPARAGFNHRPTGGYINGYDDGSFRPDECITRAEAAAMIAKNIENIPEELPAARKYTDTAGHWAEEYIDLLTRLGVTAGYADGSFRPGQEISRVEFIVMIMRIDGIVPGGAGFTDVSIAHWAADEIGSAQAKGYVNGYADGSLRPQEVINRAEAVVIMNAVLGLEKTAAAPIFTDMSMSHWAFAEIMKASAL